MASALIVGSALKFDGDWRKRVDESRVRELADALARA
jgi:predicted TIM-barrel enzyme